ncbi:hypothetical protein [Paraburkholderia sp. BR13444]|uniref:hypothetical protein n=1 Tax=Paraburkholderia sp. BR13444 TaxID=3236997 RepID=UPI0034CD9450
MANNGNGIKPASFFKYPATSDTASLAILARVILAAHGAAGNDDAWRTSDLAAVRALPHALIAAIAASTRVLYASLLVPTDNGSGAGERLEFTLDNGVSIALAPSPSDRPSVDDAPTDDATGNPELVDRHGSLVWK